MKIYAVKDEAVEAFMQPFFGKARGQAVRSFMEECQRKDSDFAKHPGDFTLWEIGTYDEEKGHIQGQEPERISRAIDFAEL